MEESSAATGGGGLLNAARVRRYICALTNHPAWPPEAAIDRAMTEKRKPSCKGCPLGGFFYLQILELIYFFFEATFFFAGAFFTGAALVFTVTFFAGTAFLTAFFFTGMRILL